MSVYIERIDKKIDNSIYNIFNFFQKKIDFNKGFLLKPNIVFPIKDKKGQISRREVISSVIKTIRKINSKSNIIIGEGTAAGTNPEENFSVSGYRKLAEKLNVKLVDLDKVDRVEMDWEYGIISIPKVIFENNYISLPILKESSAAIFSGAMKNQKGILSPVMKKKFHRLGLHKPIAYLNALIQPDLTILDGYNFFNKTQYFFAGDNCYEIDKIIASLIVQDTPDFLKIAEEISFGKETIKIQGIDIIKLKPDYKIKTIHLKKFFSFRLLSNPQACSMCRFVLKDSIKFSFKNITYSIRMYIKLLKYALSGADVIYGANPNYKYKNNKVICMGDCTKKFAENNHYIHIPGCPPQKSDIYKYF